MIPLRVWLYGGALAVIVAALWWFGHSRYSAGEAHERAANAKVFAKLAELTEKTRVAVQTRESEVRGMLDASNNAREQGIARAYDEQRALVAGIRADASRLRPEWRGCPSAASVSADPGASSSPDDAADLRATGAGDLVAAGDLADVQIRGLQAYAAACQALTKPIKN